MHAPAGLRQKIEDVFALAADECRAHEPLLDLLPVIEAKHRALHQPMRVAFVGKTNCGKSTMMNAFLGEELAPTGNGELTFNVTWFRHSERRALVVHTVDGAAEDETFDSLEHLTARCEERRELLERIRYLEVRCPNELLETFDLIDTPGLHSFYEKDSRNTRELLMSEESRPHAVVFLFSGTLQEPDVRELERFHESCGNVISGLTAIGGLTKVDECANGMEDGHRIIRQIRERHPQTRRYFYTLLPVIGPAAFGAQTLTAADTRTLAALARLDEKRRKRLLRDVSTFRDTEYPEEPEIPTTAERRRLIDRLGRHGIRHCVDALAAGEDMASLPQSLLASSNVEELRRMVVAHFGRRAFLIKARSALAALREVAFRSTGRASAAANRIAAIVDTVVLNEPRFREFAVLERYYRGVLDLDEEQVRHLLEITGENGWSCAARLGASEGTPPEELLRRAEQRRRIWRDKAFELFASVEMQEVARVVADSFSAIHARVTAAANHLRAAEELLAYDL